MIRLLTLPLLVLFCLALLTSGRSPETRTLRRPSALLLVDEGKKLIVANHSGSVQVLDVAAGDITGRLESMTELRLGQSLSHMVAAPAGRSILAVDEKSAELILLQWTGQLREQRRFKTGVSPVSVQTDGVIATVACLWPRQVQIFELANGSSSSIDLPFAPRAQLLIAPAGKLIVADAFGGNVGLIDVRKRVLESVRTLHVHNIRHLTLDQHGQSLLFTHQVLYRQGQPNRGDIQSGNLIANNVRRLALASVLNPRADLLRDERLYTLGDVERGAGDPNDVAESADGGILVTLAGVNEFAIGRPDQAIWTRLAVGDRPTALAVDHARSRAYVANTFGDSISVIDLHTPKVVAEIPLGERLSDAELSAEERGEKLFFDARLSMDGWYSCHSCHTDGHTNGRLNDNFTDGSFGTPKRVLSLLGTKDTGPWAWNGGMDNLEAQVRNSLISTMQGPKPSAARVDDLTAYLRTLPPPPAVAKARKQIDTAAVERGRLVFEERKCAVCHAGPAFTTPRSYDVGLHDEAGGTHFNPPSLRGLSQAGPFFHDSRAATVADVLTRFRHRLPEELSPRELHDLLEYLNGL